MILNSAMCARTKVLRVSLMRVLAWAVNVASGLVFLHSAVAIAGEISVPQWGDRYSSSVKALEAGKTTIDYRAIQCCVRLRSNLDFSARE